MVNARMGWIMVFMMFVTYQRMNLQSAILIRMEVSLVDIPYVNLTLENIHGIQ